MNKLFLLTLTLVASGSLYAGRILTGVGDIVEGSADIATSPIRAVDDAYYNDTYYDDNTVDVDRDIVDHPRYGAGLRSGIRKVGHGTGEVVEGTVDIATAPVRVITDDDEQFYTVE